MDSLPASPLSPRALELCQEFHKIGRTLPALVTCRTRCGKPSCRCTSGELHGPYAYLRWRECGVQRRRYVAAAELEAVRAYLDEHRRQRVASEREVHAAVRSLRRVEAMLRELEHRHAYPGALA